MITPYFKANIIFLFPLVFVLYKVMTHTNVPEALYLKQPFRRLIIGPSGCGKTYFFILVFEVVGAFDHVFLFTPAATQDLNHFFHIFRAGFYLEEIQRSI